MLHILPDTPDPWPHSDLLEQLAKSWRVQDTGEAVRLQRQKCAYRR